MVKNNLNLYKVLECKRKNSILKSVTITNEFERGTHFRLVDVEPYDITGTNSLDTTPKKYANSINVIERALHRLETKMASSRFHRKNIYRIRIFSNKFSQFEFIFDPMSMKEW